MTRTDLYIAILIGCLLVISTVALYSEMQNQLRTLQDQELHKQRFGFSLTKLKIESYLNNLRDKVAIVSYQRAADLHTVVRLPEQYELLETIQQEINDELENVNRSTIADSEGISVLTDFDGYIGGLCKSNLVDFARNKFNPIRIHPNPYQYHFDIMIPYRDPGGSFEGVFFTSFKPDAIRDILARAESGSGQYFILHREYPGLIEISSEGHRQQLTRAHYISEEESDRVVLREQLARTAWELLFIPAADNLSVERSQIQRDALIGLMLVFGIAGLFTVILFKEKKVAERTIGQHIDALQEANEKLEHLSLTDSLTLIPNRRNFDLRIHIEWNRAKRNREPLTLVFIDIDFFKQYNDHYGHVQGDQTLKSVARELKRTFNRDSDFVARYGGEEFVAILPKCEEVEKLVEFCRMSIEQLNIPHQRSEIGGIITISLGSCTLVPDQQDDLADFIHAADQALYEAKHSGRNCYVLKGDHSVNSLSQD